MPVLTVQQLVGAAERLHARKVMADRELDWMGLLESARDRLMAQPFRAMVLSAYRKTAKGKCRVLTIVEPGERLIEEALLPLLHEAITPCLSEAVHGFVPGRSTYTAAEQLSLALREGRHDLCQMDIQAYFDHIDRQRLRALLQPRLPEPVFAVISALIEAPLRLDGRVHKPAVGLAQGRAISPLLANLYLAPLDHALRRAGHHCLRYGDDLLLSAASGQEADVGSQRVRQMLGVLGLQMNEAKVRRFRYSGTPIDYLGHAVDERGVYQRISDDRLRRITGPKGTEAGPETPGAQPSRRTRTLYVARPGLYLHIKDSQILLRSGKEIIRQVPLRCVDRILLLSHAAMSSGFVSALITRKIPMQVFVGRGRAYGSLVSGGLPNPLRLRAQYDLSNARGRRTRLARNIVAAKLQAMLRRLRTVREAGPQRQRIDDMLQRLDGATSFDQLRGHEGQASKLYYQGLAKRIRQPDFQFRKRSRKPPKDAVNSLLSFSYSMLYSEMITALLAAGLDPHPGLLHELSPGHPALASDLIEPYRVLIADTFVVTLINTRQVTPEGFYSQANGGIYMTRETRNDVVTAYEHFMSRSLGGGKGHTTPRLLLDAAARAYLAVVLGECEELELPLATVPNDTPERDEVRPPPEQTAT